jgi:6-phosphogluconate dehydrogenase
MLIDAGNAHFADTRRREAALRERGLHFVGAGVSGGEEGALHGPSIMPGGSGRVVRALGPMLEDIAAKVDGEPCCVHVGPDGAGHFVKMVHNGIEYADMQLIAEAYDLLRRSARADPAEIAEIFRAGTRAARVVPDRDHRRGAQAGRRRDRQAVRRRRGSTRPSRRAPAAGPCRRARPGRAGHRHRRGGVRPGAVGPRRRSARRRPPGCRGPSPRRRADGDDDRSSTTSSRRCTPRRSSRTRRASTADPGGQQGVRLGHRPGRDGQDLARRLHHPGEVPGPHQGGVRQVDPTCPRCWSTPYFLDAVSGAQDAWRRVVATAAQQGIPAPGFASALAYYDGCAPSACRPR